MEEKKLTDEEIVKALEWIAGQYISYIDNDEDKCKLLLVDDILDLIHRLQDENEQLKCNSYTTSWKGKFFEAKKEIEWLTEEIEGKDGWRDTVKALHDKKHKLEEEVADLGKWKKACYGYKHAEQQAVKDTAKEILAMFNDKNYITENDLKNAIAERYGVEVE